MTNGLFYRTLGFMDVADEALALHKKLGGKMSYHSKIRIRGRHDLSLLYTPGVAAVSSAIALNKSRVYEYTGKRNSVAVISDGSAVLGLGNIGPEAAMPVMEGKAMLFSELASIDAVPICLSTQDPDEIIKTVIAISPSFGGISLEDIAAPNCFYIEEELKKRLSIPVMHDDQHGTAVVVLAGLINTLKVVGKTFDKIQVVISGAGAAGMATAKLLLKYGVKNIVLVDSRGAIYSGRTALNGSKRELAKLTNKERIRGGLSEVLVGADVFIGVSAPNILTSEMVSVMSSKAIVFAMANPVPEIMPLEAKKGGAYIVATGRSDFPNQINNVLSFPGIFRGVLDSGARKITDEMKIAASEAIASLISNPSASKILPSPLDTRVVPAVARSVAKFA